MGTLREALNEADLNSLPDRLRVLLFGDILRSLPVSLSKKVPAATNGFHGATVNVVLLPEKAKAKAIVRAYVRAVSGGAVTGVLTPVAYGVTPGTGEIAVAPNGDIQVLAADLATLLDVEYEPEKHDIKSITLPVVSSILTLPTSWPAGMQLLECTATVGGVIGKNIILVPGAAPVTTKQARLSVAKNTVLFTVADAVTEATVKVGCFPALDMNAKLEAAAEF